MGCHRTPGSGRRSRGPTGFRSTCRPQSIWAWIDNHRFEGHSRYPTTPAREAGDLSVFIRQAHPNVSGAGQTTTGFRDTAGEQPKAREYNSFWSTEAQLTDSVTHLQWEVEAVKLAQLEPSKLPQRPASSA